MLYMRSWADHGEHPQILRHKKSGCFILKKCLQNMKRFLRKFMKMIDFRRGWDESVKFFSSGRARDDVSSSDSDFALSSERTSKFRRSLVSIYSRRAYEERLRYLSRDWCKTERALDCPSPCSKRQTAAKLKSTSSEAENENYP